MDSTCTPARIHSSQEVFCPEIPVFIGSVAHGPEPESQVGVELVLLPGLSGEAVQVAAIGTRLHSFLSS
jgi:hypothetical protein